MDTRHKSTISQNINWLSAQSSAGSPITTTSSLNIGALVAPHYTDLKANRMAVALEGGSYNSRVALVKQQVLLQIWMLRCQIKKYEKRVFDVVLSCIALILAAPFIALVAAAIKLDSRGPVFFHQERVGKWGKRFTCYKLRSMTVDAEKKKSEMVAANEADEIVFKVKKDARVTRVGRVIRKLSIDELPQLFNVLKGDMSIVGPRPPIPYEVNQYSLDYLQRLDAIPGITGLQQVSGRSDLAFRRWIELDLQYIDEQCLGKDIYILLMTIPAVVTGKGAY